MFYEARMVIHVYNELELLQLVNVNSLFYSIPDKVLGPVGVWAKQVSLNKCLVWLYMNSPR